MNFRMAIGAAVCGVVLWAAPAQALDEERYLKAREMIAKSIAYLESVQDPETGGWAVMPEGRPQFPAITGLVVNGMLMEPDIDASHPSVARGVEFMLSFRQESGGIYDRVLANYNTAICLSALSRVNTPEAASAIAPAQQFLKGLQWSEDALEHPETQQVSAEHPFYGGVGYGSKGRADLSNTSLMLQAMHDSGLDCDDESFQRALVFLQRVQMHEDVNDMAYAEGSQQGGFIYATSPTAQQMGVGESKAGEIQETLSDGTTASRLRAYGSMTYAGFKTYIYADLDRDDLRVRAARAWIGRNYTLQENPGLGMSGMYYYLVTFSRALDAWGVSGLEVVDADGSTREVDWANDLIDRLAELQTEDGSFRSVDDRWMENNPVLITAYALLALQHAID
ncbi:MAG: prenyltransferase/squalene oxidase repeat-containing protein [Planctomycetota bacterium]